VSALTRPESAPQGLVLRIPREDEEEELLRAHHATSPGYPNFLHFYKEGVSFSRYRRILVEQAQGIGVAPGYVPSTVLFAFVGGRIVGRVSIRHRLNPHLEKVGGHIGYVVVPEFRGRGYATIMLRKALRLARDDYGISRAEVVCDEDNVASRRTIEKCGGVLRDTISEPGMTVPKRRYWIEVPAVVSDPSAHAGPPGV
jgi:predicted acetyltransferase